VRNLSDDAVDRYIRERLKAGARPATVNRETQLLGQAVRPFFARLGLPALTIRHQSEAGNVRQGFFERSDFENVVKALPEDLRDAARFGYVTGWRRGEIESLRWADVDHDAGVIRLRPEAAKNGRGRMLALDDELAALIGRRWAARQVPGPGGTTRVADLVFHRNGEPLGDFRTSWATACEAAGVEGRLFHDLRRTAVRNMVRAGVPECVAMEVSGHRTRSVFDRYNIVSEADLRAAMQRTTAYVGRLPVEANVVPLAAAKTAERGR